MYYVYVLNSSLTQRLYIGSSATPDERLVSHNAGRGGWTKWHRPWIRILLEEYPDRRAAEARERYLKSGWGRRWLRTHVLDQTFYKGSCEDLRERLADHNAGRVRSTKGRRPWSLWYSEGFATRTEAIQRERFFKSR